MSSIPPTDLRWFKLSRYEACKRWSLETWLRVLKGRKFCYEFCDEKKRYLDEWPKNLEALLKSGELVDREEILRVEELLKTLRNSREKERILSESYRGLRDCCYFLDIFRDPQELLEEEPSLNEYVKFELGAQRSSVEPLSFTEAKGLSAVVRIAESYMEPKYEIGCRVGRGFCNSNSQDEESYSPMKVGVRITDPEKYEIYRKLLGYPSDITGDYKDVVFDSDFKRLSIDEVIGEKHRVFLPLDRIYLSVDPWADESVFIAEALACRRKLCARLGIESAGLKLPKSHDQFEEFRHRWCYDRLLPYLDLVIFYKVVNYPLNDEEIHSRLFPYKVDDKEIDKIKAKAEMMISDETIRALTAIAYRSAPDVPSSRGRKRTRKRNAQKTTAVNRKN